MRDNQLIQSLFGTMTTIEHFFFMKPRMFWEMKIGKGSLLKFGGIWEIGFNSQFQQNFVNEKMPNECRRSTLVPFSMNKGCIQICKNYLGIKIMSHISFQRE